MRFGYGATSADAPLRAGRRRSREPATWDEPVRTSTAARAVALGGLTLCAGALAALGLNAKPRELREANASFAATFERPTVEKRAPSLTAVVPSPAAAADAKDDAAAPWGPYFRTFNAYTRESPMTWAPWEHMAEPHRSSTFEAVCESGSCGACGSSGGGGGGSWIWTVDGEALYSGAAMEHTFEAPGWHTVSLSCSISSSFADRGADSSLEQLEQQLSKEEAAGNQEEQSVQYSGDVMVKWLRREIRALSDDDRERFLDALTTLYRVPTAKGRALFGSGYRGMESFVAQHLDGAGQLECDHWHDDAGIVTHHVAFTRELEQVLQLLDPSIAVPYWEYTLDMTLSPRLSDSPVFSPEWFGEMSPANALNTPSKGRFAFTRIAAAADVDGGATASEAAAAGFPSGSSGNPYGLLRSPWNTNPAPFLTRHDEVNGAAGFFAPTCETYQKCFRSNSLSAMHNCLNGATHGPVHILVGGEWGHPEEQWLQEWGLFGKVVLIAKSLWRRGFLRTPQSCVGREASECRTECPAALLEANNLTEYDVLLESQALLWTAKSSRGKIYFDASANRYRIAGLETDETATANVWKRLLAALCNPAYVGEMFTSGAPYDPVFWIIHPTAERLLGQRRLAAAAAGGPRLDETWGYKHNGDVGDGGMVCDWREAVSAAEKAAENAGKAGAAESYQGRDPSTVLPKCAMATCEGHNEQDVLPFDLFLLPEGADGSGEVVRNGLVGPLRLTNAELYAAIHPESERVPYMYDSFEWPWCEEQGIFLK